MKFEIFVRNFWNSARARGLTQLPQGITLRMLYQFHGSYDVAGAVQSAMES